MAQQAVVDHAVSIRLACRTFSMSETCYRYQSKLNDDNARIAEQLIELTDSLKKIRIGGLVCTFLIYAMLRTAVGIISVLTVFTVSWH